MIINTYPCNRKIAIYLLFVEMCFTVPKTQTVPLFGTEQMEHKTLIYKIILNFIKKIINLILTGIFSTFNQIATNDYDE